jgi:hypothetical protein
MRELKKLERSAIEAVARRFKATCEEGGDSAGAWLVVAGKRVAIHIAAMKRRSAGRGDEAKPHLRFDKVAARLIERLREACSQSVPDGATVLLTVTAPIRLAAKTAAGLEDKVHALLAGGSIGGDAKDTIHGNRVQIRVLRGQFDQAPKMIGLVHNPDTDPLLLLDIGSELLEAMKDVGLGPMAEPTGERWLAVVSARGIACLETFRCIYSQLHIASSFKRALIVFSDGRVEELMG